MFKPPAIPSCLICLTVAVLILAGCNQNDAPNTKSPGSADAVASTADDGHGPDAEPEEVVEEVDPHAGHDHGDEPEEVIEEVDPHAGHDHGAEAAEVVEEIDPLAGHDDEAEAADVPAGIPMSPEQQLELGIVTAIAGPGNLARELTMSGEVAVNEDLVTHVAPRMDGIVRRVYKNLGDKVTMGQALVELDSIELAEIKSEYLACLSRIELAQQTVDREQMLLDKGISSRQEYLEAKQELDEEQINRHSLAQKLAALGLSSQQITDLPENATDNLTRYTVYSPVSGEVIEKHVSIGEVASSDSELFTIGDMTSVWVRLSIYQQDFLDVRPGLPVLIDAGHGIEPCTGTIDYIEPLIGEDTRTSIARVVLPVSKAQLRPGLFVTGTLEITGEELALAVPRSAVIELDQDNIIFVRHGNEFEPRVVSLGRESSVIYEVIGGLKAGEEIVVESAFQLKAELLKGTFDPHAGHAH